VDGFKLDMRAGKLGCFLLLVLPGMEGGADRSDQSERFDELEEMMDEPSDGVGRCVPNIDQLLPCTKCAPALLAPSSSVECET
jgi:hypothetical protein